MIFIAGVDHLVQYKNNIVPPEVFHRFGNFIGKIIRERGIEILAEEFHREYLDEVYFSNEGTLEEIAGLHGIEHLYCDPGKEERKEMGIPYHAEIREKIKSEMGAWGNPVMDPIFHRTIEEETLRRSRSYWDIREKFWRKKLFGKEKKKILFICGHEHTRRFHELLRKESVLSEIITPFWEKELFSDYGNFGL